MAAMTLPASAAAAAPQIYVGSGPDYTIAFKVEESQVYVLALEAPLYCRETESRSGRNDVESISVFPYPKLLASGEEGLEAPLGAEGNPSSKVIATFDGRAFTGTFAYNSSESTLHCQTGGYFYSPDEIPFEARRYEPVDSGATSAPVPGEVPVYYAEEASIETFFEVRKGFVDIRGGVEPTCPYEGRRLTAPFVHAGLFYDVVPAKVGESGGFREKVHYFNPLRVGKKWSESPTVVGAVTDEAITGAYLRSTQIRRRDAAPLRCSDAPISFRAVRYLPATGS